LNTVGRGFRGTYHSGRRGELLVAAAYGGTVTPRAHACPRCAACDVYIPGVGDGHVEVKTDTYDPARTPNAFLERRTITPDGRVLAGGVWRAAADGLDALVYLYVRTGSALWMWDLPDLVRRLELRHRQLANAGQAWRAVRVVNPDGYTAEGRLVPRTELAELAAPAYAVTTLPVRATG
jgi:hypothetical protein